MTRKLLLPLLALAALAQPSRAAIADLEAIAPDGFARGVVLTVAGYDANRTTLTDFPVLVRIAEYNATAGTGIQGFDYDDLMFKSTGDDICFVAEDGTPLAFEIDTWNTAGESLVWVKLPSMQNGTEFAMFYRSSKKGKVDVCTDNPFADYVGVWHLGETGSGNSSTKVFDSSGNGLTGTATGGKCLSVAASEGVLGGSWRFNDAYARNNSGIIVDLTDQTKLGTVNALGTDFTVSFWMKPYGAITKKDGVCWNALIGRKTDGNSNYWGLQLDEDPKNLRIFGSNGKDKASARSYNFTQNTWFKIDVAFYKDASNKGKYCYYVNGGGYDLDKALSGDKVAAQGTGPLGIGNFTQLSAERGFWGAMDEVRLVVGTNSADRVAADYATVATPSFLVASQVTEFEEEPKPVIGHAISDVGAAFVQFSGSISALGGTATSASILVKVWPTTGSEPSGWTTITNDLGEGAAFTAILTGLEPLSGYTYLIKAVNDLAEPYDSDVATGTFTTSGVGDAGTGGAVERQLDDFVHVFSVSERGQSVYEFTPPADVDRIDALVVAGGGPGGYYAGGGGGAGGLIYAEAVQISGGETYAITIGTGGVASASATVYGSNGGDSSIVGTSVNLVAVGGGAGGNGRLNNQGTTRAGVAGGSGGGSSWTGNAAGAGTANQGNAGGTTSSAGGAADHAGGGGGAGGAGGSVVQATGAQSSGAGGIGREIAITGEPVYYAGGGGGGGVKSFVNNGYGSAGTGGAGGGGMGGQETAATGSSVAESGTDGLGGGGGGGSTVAGYEKGGNGGNGVVIIRYGAGGDGDGVVSPTISLTGLTYDDATGVATVTYRVGWAGDGYDRADVSAIWGYDEDKLVYTNAVSTAPAIGQGTGSFSPPRMSRTIFVRLLATNTGHYAGVSPEVKTLVLFNPAAPAGTVAATPSYTTASFAATVTNLGAGATSVSGAFQVCADRFFDEGTYTTFAADEPILAAGTLSGSATGLSPNTTYWVRASLTNDVPADYDTAPVSFRTLEMGAPAGTAGVPTASDTTISAEITVSDFGVGATSATMRLEASATDDFAALAASADIAATTGVAQALTVSGLSPETTYFLRAVLENDGGLRTVLDLGSATTTRAVVGIPVSFTIPELPPNVSVASVSTNGIEVLPVEGAYTVLDGSSVVVTFAAAQGYVLSGAPVSTTVVANGDTTFPAASIPTATTAAQAIRINEIMASNPSADKGGIVSAKGIAEMDWVEFYNGASEAVDITGWHLSDNAKPGKEDKATILGSCVIPAKGYKIVWLDKIHVDPSEYAADEAFAVLKLSSSGEFLQLADPGKAVVQQVDFSTKKQIKGYSYGPLSVSSGAGLVPGNGPFVYMKTATPGAANVTEGFGDFTPAVTFSEPHGYKTEAFELTLGRADDTNRTDGIYYTLDGTSPTTASTPYTGAIHVDKTTVVRAAVPVENTILQFDTSATYIFLDDVLAQARTTTAPASAVGFPNDNAVNNQEMLYGMEQSIVTGGDRDRLLRGFTNSIATLSIVVDPANLFNSTTGIYVNPRGEGETWERQIMLEGFDPTGVGADFAQPAGIRLRGGNSRSTGKPKHSLRFFFRSSYGESSLAAKMFVGEPLSPNGEGKMKEEIGEYDKLDLRTSQNLSWANENSGNDTFVTEVFSRDSQRDLGQPYTRSRYYNLFINGQYWGLYQTQERGDEHWGEAYLGGDSLQYDLIKTASTYVNNKLSYSIECNEGTWDAWSNLWHIATQEGFGEGHEANYNKVLGLNPDGTRNPAYPVLLNAESLMVYMLVSHYVVDQDGPTSPFSSIDKGHANNFYAIRNRDDAGAVKGFVFLRHDAEMSMGQNGNTGASQNPTLWGTEAQTSPTVGSPDPTGLGNQKFRTIPYFTPAELHYLLMQNPVYKRQYADLFYRECLREGGAMTVENATARYTSRMAEIDDAIVCEAARWGKSKTRSNWLNACKTSTTFITNRVGNMKTQYQTAGWYPTVAAPFVTDADGVRYLGGGEVPYQGKVSLQNNDAQGDGTLYYTIDGTDPADSGIEYTAPFSIPDTGATVRARLFKDNEWSPLEEVALEADVPNDQRYGVRIAAIRNAAAVDPDEEFVVLTNVLDRAVSLEGLSIWSEKAGNELVKLAELGEGVELPAGGTIRLEYADWLNGSDGKKLKLKNGAIYVELRDFNGKRIQNAYVNSEGWFQSVQGDKTTAACNKTGRWFVALAFLGDTDGGEVTDVSQWALSPPPWKKGTLFLFK